MKVTITRHRPPHTPLIVVFDVSAKNTHEAEQLALQSLQREHKHSFFDKLKKRKFFEIVVAP